MKFRLLPLTLCASLVLSSPLASALDLGKLGDTSALQGSPLDHVNRRLAEQQNKDGQFEFKRGTAEFAPGNGQRIKGLVKVLTDNSKILKQAFPGYYVSAIGHTDADGNADANKKLSLARAQKVCSELKKSGLTVACKASGAGSSQPLAKPEKTAADKQRNRRVLVQVGK